MPLSICRTLNVALLLRMVTSVVAGTVDRGEVGLIAATIDGIEIRFSGRAGGVSASPFDSLNLGSWTDDLPTNVSMNRKILLEACQTNAESLVSLKQVHGKKVVDSSALQLETDERMVEGDAIFCRDRQVACLALTADCMPLVICGREAFCVVHAGWRGLQQNIIGEASDRLKAFGERSLSAVIGPCARSCCYEIGDDVKANFKARYTVEMGFGKQHLDTLAIAKDQLADANVDLYEVVGDCTICRDDKYFSHRASGGQTGRQGVVAWLS